MTEEGDRGVGNRRRRMLQPPDDEDIEDIRHAVGGRGAEGVGVGMDRGRGNSLRQCPTLSDRTERARKGRSSNRDWGSGEGEAADATVAEDLSS